MALDVAALKAAVLAAMDAALAVTDPAQGPAARDAYAGSVSNAIDTFVAPLGGGGVPAHAATHTNGTDDIQSAAAAQKGLMTAAYAGKLDGIETGADVTDAANVAAAGALMSGAAAGGDLAGTYPNPTLAAGKGRWDVTGSRDLADNTNPAENVDAVNARWEFATVGHVVIEAQIEYSDRSRVSHRTMRVALTDNPETIGVLNNALDTATGSDVNTTFSIANGADGYAYLRFTTGAVGIVRKLRWHARSEAALS